MTAVAGWSINFPTLLMFDLDVDTRAHAARLLVLTVR